jgi:trehalose/maltose transport system substrate-binding protein
LTIRFPLIYLFLCLVLAFRGAAYAQGGGDRDRDGATCPPGNPNLVIAAGAVGNELDLLNEQLESYMAACPNVLVSALETPDTSSDRLALYQQFLRARSSSVDVYAVDLSWTFILADDMADLNNFIAPDENAITDHIPELIENNTVSGRLVAMPWYVDVGLLYYRTDLLAAYFGADAEPPTTWAALEAMAREIQTGEREGRRAGTDPNLDFHGYLFQGALGEAVTVNGLEWQAAEGGGTIISADGVVQVDNAATAAAWTRAANWIGDISPSEVLIHGVEDSRVIWQAGNAAFMRNWSYAYALGQANNSAIAGNFEIAPLPAGEAGSATVLGGWSLAVSSYSNQQSAAVDLVRYLTTPRRQIERAQAGYNPTILELYENPDVTEASPQLRQVLETLESDGMVTRPSTVSRERYGEVLQLYASALHRVLSGDASAENVLPDLAEELEEIVVELGY